MSNGRQLLATLMATCGLSAAAAAPARSVASGQAEIPPEDLTTGNAQLEQLVTAAHAEGVTAGMAQGRTAERERFGAVLTGEHAADNMSLAITLLSTTDNSPDQINGALKAAGPRVTAEPIAQPGAAGNQPQRQSTDPLRQPPAGGDSISAETPVVDTGAPGGNADGGEVDDKQVQSLWKGALDSASGITTGGMPGAVGFGARPN